MMDLKVGSLVAIHSIEEPFFLAKVINKSNKHKIKIKWFDKVGVTKEGTKYSLSYEDTIREDNIICQTDLIKLSRFSFLLTTKEETRILSKIESEVDDECSAKEGDNIADPGTDNIFDKIDNIKSPIDTSNVINRICFNETETLSNKLPPIIDENKKRILLGEFDDFIHQNKVDEDVDSINDQGRSGKDNKPRRTTVDSNNYCYQENEENNDQSTSKFSDKDGYFEKVSNCIKEEQLKENSDQENHFSQVECCEYNRSSKYEEIQTKKEEKETNVITSENSEMIEESNKINVISNVVLKSAKDAIEKKYADLSDSSPTPPFVDSGSEYIPSSEDSDIEVPLIKRILISKEMKGGLVSSSSDETDNGIVIKSCKKTDTGGRIYDKRHVCYFCYKPISKMARHLAVVHSRELEIARLLALPDNSMERKEGFLCILRAGDYYHNVEVLSTRKGELILSRRASNFNNSSYRKYGPCPNCLGFFLTSNLWHHVKYNCPKKSSVDMSMKDKNVSRRDIRGESFALLGQTMSVSQEYKKYILGNFKNDEIGELCKQDEIIIKFGSMLYEKYTAQQHDHIRQTMRQLSRLVLEVKKLDSNIKDLQGVMLPKNFDVLIAAVQQLCVSGRNDAHSRIYDVPSLALKIGHSLRKCSLIVRGLALRKGDLATNREMESFLDLMSLEWNAKVSTAALRTLKEKQMNATQLLPVTSDIVKLNAYLDITIKQFLEDKNLMLSLAKWQKLAQATLSRIVLFNKRRSGEAARMTLHQYAIRPNWAEQCTTELKDSLTPLENNLANNLTVVEVIGKSRKNFKVPILLTHETKAAVDKLIETRDQVGIARNNIYVFARGSGSTKPLRGHDCLRKFAKDACLERPSTITSTKLRKYIATVVQILNLKDKEYDWLARHLGHDITIHREFYRLHESAVELTKVSRLLLALDKGEINKFTGKSLDEINVSELPDLESEPEDLVSNEENENSDEETETGPLDILQKKDEVRMKRIKQRSWSSEEENNVSKKKINQQERSSSLTLPKTLSQRRAWSTEEKEVLLKWFRSGIRHSIVPKKEDAEKCISENKPILDTRSWRDVKNWVYNKIKSLKGKM